MLGHLGRAEWLVGERDGGGNLGKTLGGMGALFIGKKQIKNHGCNAIIFQTLTLQALQNEISCRTKKT